MSAAHFVWHELMTGDVAGAAAFYSEVVGWKAQDSGMPGAQYTLLQVAEARVAGHGAVELVGRDADPGQPRLGEAAACVGGDAGGEPRQHGAV